MKMRKVFLIGLLGLVLFSCTVNDSSKGSNAVSIDKTGYIKTKEAFFGRDVDKTGFNDYLGTKAQRVYKSDLDKRSNDYGYFESMPDDEYFYYYSWSNERAGYFSSSKFIKYFPVRGAIVIQSELTMYEDPLSDVEGLSGLGTIGHTYQSTVAFVFGRTGDKVSFSGVYSRYSVGSLEGFETFLTFDIPYVLSPCSLCDASLINCNWEITNSSVSKNEAKQVFAADAGKLSYKVYEQSQSCLTFLNNLLIEANSSNILISE